MSVQAIKSDLVNVGTNISIVITDCERVKSVVENLGIRISENDLHNIQSNVTNCLTSIERFNHLLKTVHNECCIELDIFFKEYNIQCSTMLTECETIIASLNILYDTAEMCYEFYQISKEMEWILMCGITPELFIGILQPLYSFRNHLETLQVKTYTYNNKLILKVR